MLVHINRFVELNREGINLYMVRIFCHINGLLTYQSNETNRSDREWDQGGISAVMNHTASALLFGFGSHVTVDCNVSGVKI